MFFKSTCFSLIFTLLSSGLEEKLELRTEREHQLGKRLSYAGFNENSNQLVGFRNSQWALHPTKGTSLLQIGESRPSLFEVVPLTTVSASGVKAEFLKMDNDKAHLDRKHEYLHSEDHFDQLREHHKELEKYQHK